MYKLFDFNYTVELSTMPEDHMGDVKDWERAESALKVALEKAGVKYIINEGDGAFYGPKIDFHLKDCLGRTWQCGTVQLDFQLPQRFDLEYVASDGTKKCPIMIHRACFGSLERFIGILIEHFAGAFPTWIAPLQVMVIPVSEKNLEYANKIKEELLNADIRVEVDDRNEKMGYKIREAQTKKIPYMLVVGAKEEADNLVAVRSRKGGDEGTKSISDFVASIKEEIKSKTIK